MLETAQIGQEAGGHHDPLNLCRSFSSTLVSSLLLQ